MRYEPTGYIIEYEVSALIFLIVIMLRYFGSRRFPNQKNRMFAAILWVVLCDMALDIVSSIIIDNALSVPVWLTFSVNATFYFLQILLPLLMTAFTLAMVDYIDSRRFWRYFPLMIPGVVMLLLLLSNSFTHWFFYVDPTDGYVHGELFVFTYIVCAFYLVVTFLITYKNRGKLRRVESATVFRFLFIVSASMLIQYIYPALLISGVAIALAVILMYFTIQNPDTMVDVTTGAFTYEAMAAFLTDRMQERRHIRLVALKIYNMPRINDLLGIENGSLLLRQICRFMQNCARDSWVFRMRGSSFVAITSETEDYNAMCALVSERIVHPWLVAGAEVVLQSTVCFAATEELFDEPLSSQETLNYLDSFFLRAERFGKRSDCVKVDSEIMNQLARDKAVEAALRSALDSGEGLELYYQPIWSVKQRRFISAEALLRFEHPTMGYISPAEFVPIAESNGLVTAIDELVVRKVCEFIHKNNSFRDFGLEAVDVNLSALEFMRRRLPELLGSIISEYQIDSGFLCFEITETAATESFELLKDCMKTMTKNGCRFALDDFGTGYANISQVIQLPFSLVKLDKSLLYGPTVVLEHLTQMFAQMGRATVLEGVETAEQADLCERIGVDYIQGYYYARPMERNSFLKFLRDNTVESANF